jgi:hypothetical protein
MTVLTRELWRGSERVYRDQISGKLFSSRRGALNCAMEICRRQLADGVPADTPIRARRRIFKHQVRSLIG